MLRYEKVDGDPAGGEGDGGGEGMRRQRLGSNPENF